MSAKAVDYAEAVLGVHAVYETAQAASQDLEATVDALVKAREDKRAVEYLMADREQEIIQQAWVDNPDMAQTRMDKYVKTLIHADASWLTYRSALSGALARVDSLEADKAVAEADIKIAVSRMQELGGYFHYLAEVKRAASTESTGETGKST